MARLQYQVSDSPKRAGGKGYANREQTRYNDIMRSINDTEQFIKAKQAIAAQDRKNHRNKRNHHQHHMSEMPPLNANGSTLMQNSASPNPNISAQNSYVNADLQPPHMH